jgi:hypothetical protein
MVAFSRNLNLLDASKGATKDKDALGSAMIGPEMAGSSQEGMVVFMLCI